MTLLLLTCGGRFCAFVGAVSTAHLLLRRFTAGDADFLYDLDGDPDVIRFTNLDGRRAPYTLYRDVLIPRNLAYHDKYPGYGYWVAVEKEGADVVGSPAWPYRGRSHRLPRVESVV